MDRSLVQAKQKPPGPNHSRLTSRQLCAPAYRVDRGGSSGSERFGGGNRSFGTLRSPRLSCVSGPLADDMPHVFHERAEKGVPIREH